MIECLNCKKYIQQKKNNKFELVNARDMSRCVKETEFDSAAKRERIQHMSSKNKVFFFIILAS